MAAECKAAIVEVQEPLAQVQAAAAAVMVAVVVVCLVVATARYTCPTFVHSRFFSPLQLQVSSFGY